MIRSYDKVMELKNDKAKSDRLLPKVVRLDRELPAGKSQSREVLDVPPKCQNNLTKAVGDGNIRMLRHLLEKGFDVNSSSSQDSTTALHFTAWLGHLASCTLLLTYNANPNTMDMYMRTPLHLAVIKGHYKVVSLLIENGADCSLKGAGGYSAQQLVDIYNITCCRHLMKSNLTLPALTKATKNHLKKQDPYQRVLLWLDDLELNQLYPIPVPKDPPIQLQIDDKEQQDGRKTAGPKLPPLRAPCHKQSDIGSLCKQTQTATTCRKQSSGDITKDSLGENITSPDKSKTTANN